MTKANFVKYVKHNTICWEYLNSSTHLAPYLESRFLKIYDTVGFRFYSER